MTKSDEQKVSLPLTFGRAGAVLVKMYNPLAGLCDSYARPARNRSYQRPADQHAGRDRNHIKLMPPIVAKVEPVAKSLINFQT